VRFEKLTEDKIRIVLNMEDLKARNIDFHSFMAESIETQELFINMLDEAERKVGFVTKNYKLMIEALAINEGDFILTITRLLNSEKENLKPHKTKLNVKRKSVRLDLEPLIYSFSSFDDFISFSEFINSTEKFNNISKKNTLYLLDFEYYWSLKTVKNLSNAKGFFSVINEYGTYVKNSPLFERKLLEYGETIIQKDALGTAIKYFA